jgi:murein DD-endopeptidase MepM/ murein hydrolase activator NlpD
MLTIGMVTKKEAILRVPATVAQIIKPQKVWRLGLVFLALIEGRALWKSHCQVNTPSSSILRDATRVVPTSSHCPELTHSSVPLDWIRWVADMGKMLPVPCIVTGTSSALPKETLSGVLSRIGVEDSNIQEVLKAVGQERLPLNAGQTFAYSTVRAESGTCLQKLTIPVEFGKEILISRRRNGTYALEKVSLPLIRSVQCVRGVLQTDFPTDAARHGVPKKIIRNVPGAFGRLINLKRSLRPGDRFEILFDCLCVKGSKERKAGNLLYAAVVSGGTKITAYRFSNKDGDNFYTANAENILHNVLSPPVRGARKTSGFGQRIHPIFGHLHRHKGIDFSAPRNTPIFASAGGIVEKISREHGYGRCITIGHANGYSTFYAHLNGYSKSIRPGVQVKRGQVIGSVGASGNATGHHLHYEVRFHGNPINPASIRSFSKRKLSGKDLKRFLELKQAIDASVKRMHL